MKRKLFIVSLFIILFSCNKKSSNSAQSRSIKEIDTLLFRAENLNIDTKKRLIYADSVANILKSKDNDSITRHYYFELSDSYYNLGESEKNVKVCRRVYDMSLNSKDTLGVAKSLYYIGDYHYSKFNTDSAYYYYTKAEKTYLATDNDVDILRLKYNKANILFLEKDFLGCEIAVIDILKSAKGKSKTRFIHDCYNTLGNALAGVYDWKSALEYYNKAFAMTAELKEDPQYLILQAQTNNYIGIVYQKQKKYGIAANYFKKALTNDDLKNSVPYLYTSIVNNLAYSNLNLGNISSLSQFNEALQINDNINYIPGLVTSKLNLSEYYLTLKDTTKAITYSKEALQKAR